VNRLGAAGRHALVLARLTGLAAWRGFVSFYRSDNLTYAASIAYYALLSLFPLSMLALAVLGGVTADEGSRDTVLRFVLQYFPAQFDFITRQLDAFRSSTLTFGVFGTLGLIWGSLGVFGAITTAVNYAWRVEKTRSFWGHKLFTFLMLLVAGLVLLLALLLVSAASVVGAQWFGQVAVVGPAQHHGALRHDHALHPRRRPDLLLRTKRQGAVSRRVDWCVHHGIAVEADPAGFLLVHG
jgi:uncharacterized BrkB/YihY/UPF0761 family membrane protein